MRTPERCTGWNLPGGSGDRELVGVPAVDGALYCGDGLLTNEADLQKDWFIITNAEAMDPVDRRSPIAQRGSAPYVIIAMIIVAVWGPRRLIRKQEGAA